MSEMKGSENPKSTEEAQRSVVAAGGWSERISNEGCGSVVAGLQYGPN